jgi:hypothetical protein
MPHIPRYVLYLQHKEAKPQEWTPIAGEDRFSILDPYKVWHLPEDTAFYSPRTGASTVVPAGYTIGVNYAGIRVFSPMDDKSWDIREFPPPNFDRDRRGHRNWLAELSKK